MEDSNIQKDIAELKIKINNLEILIIESFSRLESKINPYQLNLKIYL